MNVTIPWRSPERREGVGLERVNNFSVVPRKSPESSTRSWSLFSAHGPGWAELHGLLKP